MELKLVVLVDRLLEATTKTTKKVRQLFRKKSAPCFESDA